LPMASGLRCLITLKSTADTAQNAVVLISAYASPVEKCAARGASGCG
jgi:hypothetical protein